MGHLVNPISFRLGGTHHWKSHWFKLGNRTIYLKNLREDLTSYKFIEYFFNYYKFLKKIDETQKQRELKKQRYLRPSQVKKFKLKQYVIVKFFALISLIFSHVNLSRFNSKIAFFIHLYDAALQNINSSNFIFSFLNNYKFKKNFNFLHVRRLKFKNVRKSLGHLRRIFKMTNTIKSDLIKQMVSKFISFKFLKKDNLNIIVLFKYIKFLIIIINSISISKMNYFFLNRLLICLLIYVKQQFRYYLLKKNSVFVRKRKNLIKFVFRTPRKYKITKKLKFNYYKNLNKRINKKFKFLNYIKFKLNYINFYLNYLYLNLFANNFIIYDYYFQRRFKFLLYISRIFYKDFNIFKFNNYKNIIFNYYGLLNENITTYVLCNYITKKLSQKYTIFEILKPVVKDLSRNSLLYGFKICCAGRLTKKQRASLIVEKKRSVPLSTVNSYIEYSTSIVILRHGICGLKIWLNKDKFFIPYAYSFSYIY